MTAIKNKKIIQKKTSTNKKILSKVNMTKKKKKKWWVISWPKRYDHLEIHLDFPWHRYFFRPPRFKVEIIGGKLHLQSDIKIRDLRKVKKE